MGMRVVGWRMSDTAIPPRNPYQTDVSDDKWVFVAHYLTLLSKNAKG